jgi:hypothetical protein
VVTFEEVRDLLGSLKKAPRNNFLGDCPLCGKDKHFYINSKTFLWDCKKCKQEGNLFKLLKHLDRLDLLEFENAVDKNRVSIKSINLLKGEETDFTIDSDIFDFKPFKLPVGWKRIYANKYLKFDRKWKDSDFENYEVGQTNLISKLKSYVIFPIRYKSGNVGYISRNELKDERLRYINSKSDFSTFFYGLDRLTYETETVILNEGLFDCKKWNDELDLLNQNEVVSLATFGNKLSEKQLMILRYFKLYGNLKNIIVCFDKDSVSIIKETFSGIQREFSVKVALAENKDIDNCSSKEFLSVVNNINTFDSFFFKRVGQKKLKIF